MRKVEHKVLPFNGSNDPEAVAALQTLLDEWEDGGWELVAVAHCKLFMIRRLEAKESGE